MAFQAVPDTAEIIIQFLENEKEAINTLHAERAGGYNLADLTALAVAVDLSIAADWLPLQTNNLSYVQTTVRGLAFENDQEVTVATSAADGGVVEKGLPGNATISIKKGSGLTGRSARGRLFWLGLFSTVLQTNENLVSQAHVTNIIAAIEATRVDIAATVWAPVIVSRFTAGAKRPVGETFPWTEVIAVNIEVDSQRGRLAG